MGERVAKGKKSSKSSKPVYSKPRKREKAAPEPPRIDWGAVPKIIAPPSLPMRHDHPHISATEVRHPEVRLVIKTRYMEQKPHVLLIESAILSTIIVIFFGLILFELRVVFPLMLSVLLPIWTLFVILLYKFFED